MLTHTLPQNYLPSMSPDIIDSLTQPSVLKVMPHVTLNLKELSLCLVKYSLVY